MITLQEVQPWSEEEAHGPHQEVEEEEEGVPAQREARCGQDPSEGHGDRA